MTDTSGITLGQLLPDPFDNIERATKRELTRDDAVMKHDLAWDFVGQQAESAIRSVLDYDVFELVARGWCIARELREYADKSKHPPLEKSVVRLGEHGFTVTAHPVLAVTVGSIQCPKLVFALHLTAHFRTAALAICDGRITEVDCGDGYVSAQLKYGDVNLHKRGESSKVQLPGRVKFASPGLLIDK